MESKLRAPILLLALLLMASACDGLNKPLNCNVGTDGISASFSRETMRQAYDEGITYPFIVEINNRGAYDSRVFIQVSHNIDIIDVSPGSTVTEIVDGKAPWNECRGGIRREIFSLTPKPLLPAVQEFSTDIVLNVCYEYQTDLNTTLCVHNNIADINIISDSCRYGEKSFGGGQGGPIGLVRAEAPIYLSDGKVRIRFYLRNYRAGSIVASDTGMEGDALENACRQSTGRHVDYVKVEGYLDQAELNCSLITTDLGPEGYSKLRADPQRTIQNNVEVILKDYYLECETKEPVPMTRPREMTVNMRLEYYYRELGVETRTINIRRV
jgi:hypothetical protein